MTISILLLILKSIGIVLLWILGIVLVLLLLVLFVPVRYAIDGSEADGTPREEFSPQDLKEHLSGNFRFSWLLHFIRGGIRYPEDPQFSVYVLFFRVFRTHFGEPADKHRRKKKGRRKKGTRGKKGRIRKPKVHRESSKSAENPNADRTERKTAEERTGTNSGTAEKTAETAQPQYKFRKIYDSIRKALKDTDNYLQLFRSDLFRKAFDKASRQIGRVLRMLAPKQWSLTGTLGFGDPEKTGELLELLAFIYPFTRGRVQVDPDFYNCIADVKFRAKGRVTLFIVLYAFLVCWFDRDVKHVIRLLKREES